MQVEMWFRADAGAVEEIFMLVGLTASVQGGCICNADRRLEIGVKDSEYITGVLGFRD